MKAKTKDAHYYAVARLSENIVETPEGYLLCIGVPIARTGELTYVPGELIGADGKDVIEPKDGRITIERDEAALFDPRAMASFEGKSVTIGHPTDFVSPQNYLVVTVGHMQNVRRGEGDDVDKLVADLLIMESAAISMVKAGLREVSLGYDADYEQVEVGRGRQTGIVGNHVALVRKGRNGSEVAVRDSAPENTPKTRSTTMKKAVLQGTLMKFLGRAFDAMPEEIKEETTDELIPGDGGGDDDINARLGRLEEMLVKLCENGTVDEGTPPQQDSAKETTDNDMSTRLATIEAAVSKLLENKAAAAANDAAPELADAETVARAEILVPGMQNSGTLIKDTLIKFGQDEVGKKVLATLDSITDETAKFIAAAELVKSQRTGALTVNTIDAYSSLKGVGGKSPQEINEANAKHWGL
jgi:hypothetical protein